MPTGYLEGRHPSEKSESSQHAAREALAQDAAGKDVDTSDPGEFLSVEDVLASAGRKIAARQFREAAALLRGGASKFPDDFVIRLTLARALSSIAPDEEALAEFERAMALRPDHAPCRLEYCNALVIAGRAEDAVVALNELVTSRPDDCAAVLALARAHAALGNCAEALSAFASAQRIEPQNVEIRIETARCLADAHRLEEAARCYSEALGIEPRNKALVEEQARLLRKLRRYDEAADCYLLLAEQEPEAGARMSHYFEAARIRFEHGRAADSLAAFEAARQCDPRNVAVVCGLARALTAANLNDKAIEALDAALEANANDEQIWRARGESFILNKDARRALECFERVVTISKAKAPAALLAGKAAYSLRQDDIAAELFEMAIEAFPDHAGYHVDLGRALARQKRVESARAAFQAAVRLSPDNHDAHHGLGAVARLGGDLPLAIEELDRALAINPKRVTSFIELGQIYDSLGDVDSARRQFELAHAAAPSHTGALLSLARIDFERGDIDGAAAKCERVLQLDPDNRHAALYSRWISRTIDTNAETLSVSICLLGGTSGASLLELAAAFEDVREVLVSVAAPVLDPLPAGVRAVTGDWRDCIASASSSLVLTIPQAAPSTETIARIRKRFGHRVGVVHDVDRPASQTPALWRRELLLAGLALNGSHDWDSFATDLAEWAQRRSVEPAQGLDAILPASAAIGREAWLVSSSGVKLFGGVEQFLRTMAPIYRSLGMKPVIIGLLERLDGCEPSGEADGVPFINILRTPETIRRLAYERRPVIAHGTTGIGFELTAGLEGLATRVIYGSHFWRDMFVGSGSFENVDLNPRPRAEFAQLCASVDQPYVNSFYTRDMVGRHFGQWQPVVYSLPFDCEAADVAIEQRSYCLLMNGRLDKGFGLMLELAERLPQIDFVVVAAQVAREQVEELIESAGAVNIKIADWTADTATLYRNARAVLVPSYSFVETFSRVAIEAHRHGAPVIGSNRGNVPNLLEQSGRVLEEDAAQWADEVRRLFDDDAYWRERSRKARENSDRYRFEQQYERVGRLVKASLGRIAVAVGSGIGNLIQCSPTIRRVAEHTDRPVDVLLRGDFSDCSCLFEGAPWVGSVVTASDSAVRYDAVLVLDCYGALIPQFNAEVVHTGRRRFNFSQMATIHESEFNLMHADQLLGVPYRREDIGRYFLGAFQRTGRERKRIAIHAGSKAGVWAAKQWPRFEQLATHLRERGYEVASFGSCGEYVPGTLDLTGVDLPTTIRNLADCHYFVGNDSGLMHVADALELPLTTIFAPTSVVKNGPLSKSSRVIKLDKSCSPCQFDTAKLAKCRCIDEIGFDEVAAAIDADLADLR
nr:tetratricopeptide repeat protein [Methylosinus sp. Sm6]